MIATVSAGVMTGNFGLEVGMTPRTRVALRSFWEYVSFVINSLVFLLIGIEVHVSNLAESWRGILLAIGSRPARPRRCRLSDRPHQQTSWARQSPLKWMHVLVWGGIHGSVSMALALSLRRDIPYRNEILTMTFGVVAFSIIVQGLTVKPLLRLLGIETVREDDYDLAKARCSAFAAAHRELDLMLRDHLISATVHDRLDTELNVRIQEAQDSIANMQEQNASIVERGDAPGTYTPDRRGKELVSTLREPGADLGSRGGKTARRSRSAAGRSGPQRRRKAVRRRLSGAGEAALYTGFCDY